MNTLVNGSAIVLPVLYTLLLVSYAQRFLDRTHGLVRLLRGILFTTLTVHAVAILARAAIVRTCPVTAQSEIFSLVAFTILSVYVFLEGRTDRFVTPTTADPEVEPGDEAADATRSTGVFVVATAFLMQLTASILSLEPSWNAGGSLAFWPSLHVFTGVIGISAVAVASVYGVLYLFLYRALKRGRFGLFYQRMPDLETLGRINFRAVVVAFAMVSLTIAGGLASYWTRDVEATFSLWRVTLTLSLWALYGALIVGHLVFKFGGKRLAYSTVLGFLFAFSILLVGLLRTGGAD